MNQPLHFVHLEQVDSSQNAAKCALEDHDFVCVLADCQHQGRGRSGNVWQATHGDFICSVGMRLPVSVDKLTAASLVTGVVALEVFNLTRIGIGLKWPNDLIHVSSRRKLGGILIESGSNSTGQSTSIVAGIGINAIHVSEKPSFSIGLTELVSSEEADILSSPYEKWAKDFSHALRLALLNLAQYGFKTWSAQWNQLSVHQVGDSVIKISSDSAEPIQGVFQGVSDTGALILATSEGEQAIVSGHVESW